MTPSDVPGYTTFILPAIRAVAELGGSAQARQIVDWVIDDLDPSEEMASVMNINRPDSPVLPERVMWGRSYAKLIGALASPKRGLFLLTDLGRELLADDPDRAQSRVVQLDRDYRRSRAGRSNTPSSHEPDDAPADAPEIPSLDDEDGQDAAVGAEHWADAARRRLHRLTPDGFERCVLALLRSYGLRLERVGGSGDEGIDGIGTAPISPVLSSRVAVQIKRYAPDGKPIGRETVALFQHDAANKGAERAILVTLSRFTEPARRAATTATPTVDLIDGDHLAQLMRDQEFGIHLAPVVNESWFDQFDK